MRQSSWNLAFWGFLVVVTVQATAAEKIRPSETYLPNTTAAFLSLANPPEFVEQFKKTQIGELVRDPVMEPFTKDLRRQFEDRIANLKDHLAITMQDVENVSGGEAAVGSIRPAPGKSAIALVANVTDHVDEAKKLLTKISDNLKTEGAKGTKQTVGDVTVLIFELPQPKGTDLDTEGVEKKNVEPQHAVYCLAGSLLLAADRLDILEGMLSRVPKERGDALSDMDSFKQVMQRCTTDAGDEAPQARWYIQPVNYADILRTNTPPHQRRKGKSIVTLMQEQGFSAIQGVGGHVNLSAENTEITHRTAIYAPAPWEKSMKMIAFQNGEDFAPQKWVPREIATYNTFYFDVATGFDNFGPLYGEVSGLKDKDAWLDAVKSLAEDNKGPKIHLRNDLCALLGPRITIISDYQVPIMPTSERLLFALEIKGGAEAVVAKSIEKLMLAEDPPPKKHVVDGHTVWEVVPPEADTNDAAPVVVLPGIGGGGIAPVLPDDKEEEEKQVPLLPHAAITVAHGHLFCASHLDFLLKALKTAKTPDPLDRDASYKAVDEMIAGYGIKQKCARTFSFTDEEFRPTYELIRMNKLPESETMLARMLNTFAPESKKGQIRKPKIEGQKLPEYDVVRRYLGPAGVVATCEKDGWFIKGCLLKKQ